MSNLTSSQNLVLGLLGGLSITPPSTAIAFSVSQVTAGPQNLNTLNPKQFSAYMDVTPDELPTNNAGIYTSYLTVRGVPGNTYVVPEFLDHIPIDPPPYHMPILYMRARVGSQGIVTLPGDTTVSQYSSGQIAMYPQSFNNAVLFTDASFAKADTNTSPPSNDFPPSTAPGNYPNSTTAYLANPGFVGQPRGKDSFILISAGIDHIFGTSDDIIYSQ